MGKTLIENDENKVTKKPKAVVNKNKPASDIEKLKSHANKHITAWHTKSGENRVEFAKHIAKHARALLKQ